MRELTVRLRFTRPSLGNVRSDAPSRGCFRLHRDPHGRVVFLASWHRANMELSAKLLGRHQDEVRKILWDVAVVGEVRPDCWHRRYYKTAGGRTRYAQHECLPAGQVVGVRCVVPPGITDDDVRALFALAGRYKGLSQFGCGDFGLFAVEAVEASCPAPAAERVEGVLLEKS